MGSVVTATRSSVAQGAGAVWLVLTAWAFPGCGESHAPIDGSAAKDGADDAGVESDGCASDGCTSVSQNRDAGFVCADGFDVQDEFTCDGFVDCAGGEDESADLCSAQDEPPMYATFTCASDGAEIPGSWRCDGVSDCQDGSDEFYCPTQMAPADDGGFVCGNGEGVDIPDGWVCDGFQDCPDGDDESACVDAGVEDGGVSDGGVEDGGMSDAGAADYAP